MVSAWLAESFLSFYVTLDHIMFVSIHLASMKVSLILTHVSVLFAALS